MSGTLFVVATPIGNLEDITLRALRVLRSVDLIAAEDTRHTAGLLAHHGIQTRTISFHQHNTRSRVPQLIARLNAGENIAVVSDAGTPGMSDPGVDLVAACAEAGIAVDPVPGASAALAAVVASGFSTEEVLLLGFPPSRGNARKRWIQRLGESHTTVVLFEGPHRILALLTDLAACSVERPIVVARELTKLHQQLLRGTAASIREQLREPKGEFTVVLAPISPPGTSVAEISAEQLLTEFGQLTERGGILRRQAVVELSQKYGYKPNKIYSMIERAKISGE